MVEETRAQEMSLVSLLDEVRRLRLGAGQQQRWCVSRCR